MVSERILSGNALARKIMAKILRGESGFTLLEGMIATAVLAVGVLGIGSMQGIALRRNSDSTELLQATNMAAEMMERIQYNRRNVSVYNGIDTTLACGQNAVTQPMALGDCLQWQGNLNGGFLASGSSQASGLRGATGTGVVRGTVTVAPILTNPMGQSNVTIVVTWGGLSMANRTVRISSIVAPE